MGEKISQVDYYNLKEEILQREQEIIGKYDYHHDNNTGLGKHSLTSRSKDYNLLEFDSAGELRKDSHLIVSVRRRPWLYSIWIIVVSRGWI